MSINDDRPNADGEGAGDQSSSEWIPRCSELTASSATGQTPPPQFQPLFTPCLPGLEKIQEITDLTFEELPIGYRRAFRKLKEDRYLFELFETIAFIQITRLGETSADKIEGEIRLRYKREFCHFTRTLLGRLFLWKHPRVESCLSVQSSILDTLAQEAREELARITR